MEKKHVTLISLKENIDTSTAQGKLMLTMLGAINEFERMNMLERQREGIAIAKANGKYKGRKAIEIDQKFKELYEQYMARKINKTQFANELDVSRTTLYKLIEEYEAS
ncbi:recombinase family protein [Metabacillus hrfriensis]|uniref:Recombinase family protein n=1 Tax=Metabacillus hrfriensis TaxID=3048891 RepID=A0ACD4RHS5_9BACI|nr:recombinase family protein [Metabacillus sp. CT-WN-B3]WHZ60026.1 recombinase family protein [Metabacillus sp. CT-WN-B3]